MSAMPKKAKCSNPFRGYSVSIHLAVFAIIWHSTDWPPIVTAVGISEACSDDRRGVRQFGLSNRWRCRTPYAAAFTASSFSNPDPGAPPNVATAATSQAIINKVERPTGWPIS
jgi:hypothetical protein